MTNALYLGDEVFALAYWPLPGDTGWRGRVKALRTGECEEVLVEALEISEDPLVENERWFAYGALRRSPKRPNASK